MMSHYLSLKCCLLPQALHENLMINSTAPDVYKFAFVGLFKEFRLMHVEGQL